MKVGIVGAGAIGLLYGAKLTENAEVIFFTKRKEQAEALAEKGVFLDGQHHQLAAREVDELSQLAAGLDVLILTMKSYQLDEFWPNLALLPEKLPLLFLQNGVAHLKQLANCPQKIILVGSSEHGAVRENDYTVSWRGKGRTNFSIWRGELSDELLHLFQQAGSDFPFIQKATVEQVLRDKWFINLIINPLTAAFMCPNGDLLTKSAYRAETRALVDEVAPLFQKEASFEKIQLICEQTAGNWSSMAEDVRHGRRTEIASILLPALEAGEAQGVPLPRLTFLYHLIKGKEGETHA
ncbi:2-dehydropantoate 2-reductase [Listeria costaricensis]|uniref:2-dehydropantoate 2-reductase n=1 Tax=Listeria costaricensis TaxID=2026604 RepID=UPI000C08B42C|nr:2-dehydropantoate 2-reductase [Listeria costaricensis]